ncbi:MAG: ImmA/IrrE family metallo-endopeptidase [Dehalococcoidales bacterium]|nr:ImmA/IrrE family metallo-endopeptidase [Dehalococcoidales bacterium]
MEANTFNPAWLVIARQSRGLTQKELAQSLSVNQGWLSRIESGLRNISEEKLEEVSKLLDYPVSFFCQPDPPYLAGRTDIFHRKTAVPEKVINKVNGQLTVISTALERLLEGIEIEGISMESVDLEEYTGSIETIAQIMRSNWGVPRGPVQNVTKLIENAKAIVIPFDFGTKRIDATSFCLPKATPLFFVNSAAFGDRLRFTLCHELGHIIMHQGTIRESREDEANRFAAEFLMPERDIAPYLDDLTFEKLASLKIQWRVSMAALLKRAQTIGTITSSRAKALWVQLSKFKQREPKELDIPLEIPSLYQEIVDAYQFDLEYEIAELSALLRLSENDIYQYFIKPQSYDLVDEAERIIKENQAK